MVNQNEISSVLQDGSYFLVNKHYNSILKSQYALYTNDDYDEHEIQCLRILIKSLTREFVVDYTSDIAQQLYIKLLNIVSEQNDYNYTVDINLQKSNEIIVIVNGLENIEKDIDIIYINISDLQSKINLVNTRIDNLETTFISLTDTPNDYLNQANKLVIVNSTQTGLEFINQPITKIETNVISDVNIGGINAGDILTIGTNIQELVELLLKTTFYPIFINPSISISNNIGNNIVEVGSSQILTITLNYDFGEIKGSLNTSSPFIWNTNLKQNNRSGDIINYVINNVSTGLNNFRTINGYVPINGYNNFSGYLNYATGLQPLDSKSLPYDLPYNSGSTATITTSFLAYYKQFFGNVSSFPTDSNSVRNLENNNFANINNFNGFISDIKYVIAIPTTKNLVSVITANFENITDKFVLSSTLTSVNDGSGNPVNYKIYQFSSDSPLNLNITINLT